MEIFGIKLGILQGVTWLGYAAVIVGVLPFGTSLLDSITQLVSNAMIFVNKKVVDKVPLSPLRNWLQERQVNMLKKSIISYKNTIAEIEKV